MNEEEFIDYWNKIDTKYKIIEFDGGSIFAQGYNIVELKTETKESVNIEKQVQLYILVDVVVLNIAVINMDKIKRIH